MKPSETCEVCGGDVASDEGIRAELSVGQAMCPAAMVFHDACYEKARDMWQPDPELGCAVDPDFPETGRWLPDGPKDCGVSPSGPDTAPEDDTSGRRSVVGGGSRPIVG